MKKVRGYLTKTAVGDLAIDNQVDEITIILPDNIRIKISLWTKRGDAVLVKPVGNSRLFITPGPVDNTLILTAHRKATKI